MKKLILFILSSLLLIACGEISKEEDLRSKILGETYKLEGAVKGSVIDITFDEEQITGSAGVNRYFADYEIEGNGLTIGFIGSTRMMGPEKLMIQELLFTSSLETAKAMRASGNKLFITLESGEKLKFLKVVQTFDEFVKDKTLTLEGTVDEHEITINFVDGMLSGNSGVNNYSSSYEIDGEELSVSPQVISTMMAGSEVAMEQETNYISDLMKVDGVIIKGNKLILTLEDGETLIFK